MLTSAGRLILRSKAGTGNINSVLAFTRPTAVSISSEVETVEARGFPISDSTNKISTLYSEIVGETWTLSLDQEAVDELDFQRNIDARIAEGASAKTVPLVKIVTVPSSAPYTVTISDMTATTADGDVSATIVGETPEALQRVLAAGTPAAGEFAANASKEIEFHSSAAGQKVMVYYFGSTGSAKIIGGDELRNSFTNLEFLGKVSGPGIPSGANIWCPSISRITGAQFGVSASIEAVSLQYRINTIAGYNLPFLIWI